MFFSARQRRPLNAASAFSDQSDETDTAAEPPAEEQAADDDSPSWLTDMSQLVRGTPEEAAAREELVQRKQRKRLRAFLSFTITARSPLHACRRISDAQQLSYVAACCSLLAFLPSLPHVLSATPRQLHLFALALLVLERGTATESAVQHAFAADFRAAVEERVHLEVAPRGDGAAKARQSAARARDWMLRTALCAPLELVAAPLCVLAPFTSPGVALLCLAALPLRAFAWRADEFGVVFEVPAQLRRRLLWSDNALLVSSLLVGLPLLAWPASIASLAAVLQQILWSRDSQFEELPESETQPRPAGIEI